MGTNNRIVRPLIERFLAKVKITEGCWLWTGYVDPQGYGRIQEGGGEGNNKSVHAHRISYEWFVGPITLGYEVDHTCHDFHTCHNIDRECLHRRCVNPEHLDAVPPRKNVLRSNSVAAVHAVKTHCKRGHPLTPDNLLVWPSAKSPTHRRCHQCMLILWRASEQRRKAREAAKT